MKTNRRTFYLTEDKETWMSTLKARMCEELPYFNESMSFNSFINLILEAGLVSITHQIDPESSVLME